MQTIWKGSISFGLVNVPVKLHAATESKEFHFNFLHSACHQRIRTQKKCIHCDTEVNNSDLVKGYEYEKDHYVILTDEDLAILEQPMNRSIDILDFVNLNEIDPIYYQKSYYLSPEENAAKAYRLLCQAMEESGKVALARLILRSKQHLACLRVFEEGLILETMYYPNEIRHLNHKGSNVIPTETEISMARQLIENLARSFDPAKYRDELQEQLAAIIDGKIKGEAFKLEAAPQPGKVMDLMEALRASISLTEQKKGTLEQSGDVFTEDETHEPKTHTSILKPRKKSSKQAKGA